ncbi:hypothetical protein [Nonomuraea indica]|uniref:hypothetical protein n=1 Tax=Nonomuraea indica TaxID=1581193 RepID=UPI000C7C7CC3|nr:hypothetical protein [Nonomuraea indica]
MTSRFWARVQLALALVWMLLIAPTLIWWRDSVLWVALMSLWANIAAHLSAWQAARAERKIDEAGEAS